ncbi:MAG TPA: glycosyltransferase family 4 protein [Anaerolineae bacterium]|nr:glycosyltransferase family 4 protein [Anaerolineae bacterium]
MRICSPQLGISLDATLGGEVYDREILTRLAVLGAEVEAILPAGLPCPQVSNLWVTRVPLRRGYRWFVSNPVFVPYIAQVYRRRPFDLLRVHSLRFTGPAALVARRLLRLPVPVVAHHHHVERDRWTNHVDRRVARRCDLIITGSRFARQQLISELGVAPDRIEVVYNGVGQVYRSLPRDEKIAARLGVAGRKVLLYLGSLKPRKNLGVLLQAFRRVLRERKYAHGVHLLLAGRGESEAALRRQTLQLGLEGAVHFAGFVPEEEKVAWYNLADIFVFPSRLEGFGLAAAEAMACGKSVVASRAGALPEVVADSETGILCDPDDPADFARAILRLLEDPSLAEKMGKAGLARAKRLFQWDETARRPLAIYEEAVREWGKGRRRA